MNLLSNQRASGLGQWVAYPAFFSDSSFQSFCGWIWQNSLAATVLVVLVVLVQLTLRKVMPPRWSYALWCLVVLRLILPVAPHSSFSVFNWVWTGPRPTLNAGDQPVVVSVPGNVNHSIEPAADMQPVADMQPAGAVPAEMGAGLERLAAIDRGSDALPSIWLLGFVVCLGIAIRQHWRWTKLVRRQPPIRDSRLIALLESAQRELGVRRAIPLMLVPSDAAPAVFGFWKPYLLLPEGLAQTLDDRELRLVFLHELIHLKRGDVLVNWLLIAVQSLHWFNPFVWLAVKRFKAERELVCDAAVLRGLEAGEYPVYGHTLLKVAIAVSRRSLSPSLVPILQRKPKLERRIHMIAKHHPTTRLVAIMSAILLIALGWFTFTGAAEKDAADKTSPPTLDRPRAQVERRDDYAQKRRDIAVLEAQLAKLKERVAKQEALVDRFPVGGMEPETLRGLEQLRIEASAEYHRIDTMYTRFKELQPKELGRALDTATIDQQLAKLMEELARAERRLAGLSQTHGAEHPEIKSTQDVIAITSHQVNDRVEGIMAGLKVKGDAQKAKLDSLQAEIDLAKKRLVEESKDRRLAAVAKRDLESLQRVKEALFVRLIQEQINAALLEDPAPSSGSDQ